MFNLGLMVTRLLVWVIAAPASVAADKVKIAMVVKSLGNGFWVATSQFAVPGTPAYNPALPEIKQDLVKAKQLLTEAGYANGLTIPLLGSTVTTFKDMVVAEQGMLAKIGVTMNINLIDHPQYNTAIQKGWDGFAAAGKLIDANMGWALGTNFSQKVLGISASGIRHFFELIANMDGCISLGVGEPDFVTPQPFARAAL